MFDRNITPSLVAVIFILFSTFAFAQAPSFPLDAEAGANLPPNEIMLRAAPLLQEGKNEEATFWYYAGQLRWRSRLNTSPDQDPTGEPALFSSLLETLGQIVNGWSFGDIPKLQRTIDTVLLWDKLYPDPSLDPVIHERMRAGLKDLRDQIGREADMILAERALRGLENR